MVAVVLQFCSLRKNVKGDSEGDLIVEAPRAVVRRKPTCGRRVSSRWRAAVRWAVRCCRRRAIPAPRATAVVAVVAAAAAAVVVAVVNVVAVEARKGVQHDVG